MGRWAILGSADPPGSARAGASQKLGSADKSVSNLKDCQNRPGSSARLVPERGRSGYIMRDREAGLALRSRKLGTAFANKRRGEGGVSMVEMSVALFLLTAVAVFGFQT